MTFAPYRWLLENVLLPSGDAVMHQHLMARLRFLRRAQWWDAAQIEAYRNARLTDLLRTAYETVPFYRALFEQHRLSWRDVTRCQELAAFPVVTKDMLRSGYPQSTVRDTGRRTYEAASSGSTGEPFRVREDAETAGQYRAAFLMALEWSGWRIGDPHVQIGAKPSRGLARALKDTFLRCMYVVTDDLTDDNLSRILIAIDRRRILYLLGYPSSIYLLGLHARKLGWNQPFPTCVTWGEMCHTHQREIIEQAFHAKVFDTYGVAEGVQVAAQCGNGSHYHLQDLDTVVEFVNDRGAAVGKGEPGHVLLTRLHPGPMPLIRYEVGDVATRATLDHCACGRQFQLLESIQGRDTDFILTPSGNRLVAHCFTSLMSRIAGVNAFQVVQRERDGIDVNVVADPCDRLLVEQITAALQATAKDLTVRVHHVAAIEAKAGKRRFIINELPREVIKSCMPHASFP
ncbi:MAG: phenylacetate--CoA ligase family protein [Bryobacterales bacterium]|nr:phenylacetate--CoA ligase family protein [Bryobacterales bacterium]